MNEKKVFQIPTTAHPNASHGQVTQLNNWLIPILENIARQTGKDGIHGTYVSVIVEVVL